MRDLPSGAALLALARDVLLGELLPLLPEEARVKTRLVATCMAIAAREAAAGEAPVAEILAALRDFYDQMQTPAPRPGPLPAGAAREVGRRGRDPSPRDAGRGRGPSRREPSAHGLVPWGWEGEEPLEGAEDLLRRLALDLRKGAFETSQSRERAARAMLWRLTIAKLREGNPDFLAANRINGS